MDGRGTDIQSGWGLTLALGAGVLLLVYIYNSWRLSRLRREGIPGPRGIPIFGSTLHVIRKGVLQSEAAWTNQYGDVYAWDNGKLVNVVVKDPEFLREVLVKDFSHFTDRSSNLRGHPIMQKHVFGAEGKAWKRIRSILSPTFSTGKMKLMNGDINRCSRTLTGNLVKAAKLGKPILVKQCFGAFTMDVISATAFSLDVNSQTNTNDPFVNNARALFVPRKSLRFTMLLANIFPPFKMLLNWLQYGFFPGKVIDFFVRAVTAMLEDRRANPNTRTDFLQLMMNAELESTTENGEMTTVQKKLSTEEIIAQAVIFFLAGYETTATLLQFTAYELAVNPDVQERMYREIQDALGDVEPVYENINKLTYVEQVLFEVLRMYPPLNRITRVASEDRVINGIPIRKGFIVTIPIYNIHHDSRYYPEPSKFRPDRFADPANRNNVMFLPFGYGPRTCIGMRLALVEVKIALVHMLRDIKFVPCKDTQIPMEIRNIPGFTQPVKPISVGVISRN